MLRCKLILQILQTSKMQICLQLLVVVEAIRFLIRRGIVLEMLGYVTATQKIRAVLLIYNLLHSQVLLKFLCRHFSFHGEQ